MDHFYQILGMNLFEWAFLVAGLIAMYSILRSISRKNSKNTPLNILHRKFSKGKISQEEYEKLKRFLEKEQDLKMRIFFHSSFSND